jgi:hypothetical protein
MNLNREIIFITLPRYRKAPASQWKGLRIDPLRHTSVLPKVDATNVVMIALALSTLVMEELNQQHTTNIKGLTVAKPLFSKGLKKRSALSLSTFTTNEVSVLHKHC